MVPMYALYLPDHPLQEQTRKTYVLHLDSTPCLTSATKALREKRNDSVSPSKAQHCLSVSTGWTRYAQSEREHQWPQNPGSCFASFTPRLTSFLLLWSDLFVELFPADACSPLESSSRSSSSSQGAPGGFLPKIFLILILTRLERKVRLPELES